MLVYYQFYCSRINLFCHTPHIDDSKCCEMCIVDIPLELYKEDSWYPFKSRLGDIKFSTADNVWTYYQQCGDTEQ